MTNYTLINLVALVPALVVSICLRRHHKLSRTMKLSMVAPLVSFPWLYFGISQKSWAHGDPGLLFMGVPVNEVILAFLMTFINSGIFILNYKVIMNEAGRGTEAKDGSAK